jgi:hypothetical protein
MRALSAAVVFLSTLAAAPASSSLSGTWTLHFQSDPNDVTKWEPPVSDCTLQQKGTRITGTCGSDKVVLSGAVGGRNVTFELRSDQTARLNAQLDEHGRAMSGTWRARTRVGRFQAQKQ